MLIIGSHALRTYNRDRTVKDIDIIATREEADEFICQLLSTQKVEIKDNGHSISVRQGKRLLYEFFIVTDTNTWGEYAKLVDAYDTHTMTIACPEILFSIKCSHIHMPTKLVKFKKHI